MNVNSHIHEDDIIVDGDSHFIIDTTTRAITNAANKKLALMQYDNKSERFSFEVNRIIEGHDVMDCDRVQIHFINIGSNRQQHPGLYLVEDVQVNPNDETKVLFTWLISQDATSLSGVLSFLVSFECTEGEKIVYRWSSSIHNSIGITNGMDNDNTIVELYADELLAWENKMELELSAWQTEMETEFIPNMVDERYIERDFATSEEVAGIFGLVVDPDDILPQVVVPYEEVTDAEIDALFVTSEEENE